MPHLVIGDPLLLLLLHEPVLLFEARHDPLDGLVEVLLIDGVLAAARRQQRRLVGDVGKVRPHKTGGLGRDLLEVYLLGQDDVLAVDREDVQPALLVGLVHQHVTVKASRAQEGRIEDLRPVGGGHEDKALSGVETVHLDQKLVEGLLPLVVAAGGVESPRLCRGRPARR